MNEIYHIYDKAFKRILTLSEKTVINLINGLFDTDYPTDSKITYNWTEHENKDLKRTLADSILTINGRDSYHIEAQMTEDEEIVFRFIEYGFGHAYKNRTFIDGGERMVFPRPCILYLDEGKKDKVPDEYTLIMQFENPGEFPYKVPVIKLHNFSAEELNNKKLLALLPFHLLKLRKKLQKIRTKENLEELQRLVADDIILTIERNAEVGNISPTDALDLIEITTKLYMKIYSKYEELEEFTMRMCDQSMELISDKYEKTVEDLQDEITLAHDRYKKEIEGMQDELANTHYRYKEKIEGMQDELANTRNRYKEKIEGMQDELANTRNRYKKEIEGLQDELANTRNNYKQKISGLQDEMSNTRNNYEQKISGLQDEMSNTRNNYEQKISGLQDEVTELKDTIRKLQEQLQSR